MAKDHLIPAAFIARFSDDPTEQRSRKRPVTECLKNGKILDTTAQAIGYKSSAYNIDPTISPQNGKKAIDKYWDSYEPNLNPAIDSLEQGTLTITQWIDILVPFVAGLFARSNEFASRVKSRNSNLRIWLQEIANSKDNVNENRLLELSQYAAKLLSYRWTVYPAEGHLIMPDTGYTIVLNDNKEYPSFWVPLDQHHMLVLSIEQPHVIATKREEKWVPNIKNDSSFSFTSAETNLELLKNVDKFFVGEKGTLGKIDLSNSQVGLFIPDLDDYLHRSPWGTKAKQIRGLYEKVQQFFHGEIQDCDTPLDPTAVLKGAMPDTSVASTKLYHRSLSDFCTITQDTITIKI